MENTNKHPYLIFLAIIIAGIMVAGAILWREDNSSVSNKIASSVNVENMEAEQNNKTGSDIPDSAKNIKIAGEGDDPILGDPDAKITMVIFGDFQCHFCKKLETEIKPIIIEEYVKTGKVKIIARDFPFLGQASVLAASAANCAFEQNRYWEYSELLHSSQTGHDPAPFVKESLSSFAQKLGLEEKKFNECLDSDKYLDEVKKDFDDGRALGVAGTPTSFINGEVLKGALPFEEFKKVIDKILVDYN